MERHSAPAAQPAGGLRGPRGPESGAEAIRHVTAQRRSPEAVRSLEELEDCVSGRESVETELENRRIEQVIEDFLWRQEEEKRNVFLLRYWYFMSIENICRRTGFGESKVKSMLSRTRQKLRQHLEQEGIEL